MANSTEDIILNIEIKYEDGVKRIAELKQSISELQSTQKDLKKSLEEGKISQEEYAKSSVAVKVETDRQKDSVRLLEKELRNNLKVDNEKVGSLNQLKAALSSANSQYGAMSEYERANSDEGRKLAKDIDNITAKLKTEEEALGNHRRSVGDYEKATRSLRSELKEYTNQLAQMIVQGKQGTPEYEALRLKVGGLKDAFDDAGTAIKNTANDTYVLTGLTQAVGGVVGAFGAYQSIVAAVGVENEACAQTIKNMQTVTTALNSLTAIQTALQKESAAATLASNIAAKSGALAQKILGASVLTTSTAFKVLRAALITTGIGALVVGIGLLVANFDKLIPLFKKGEDGMSSFGKAFAKVKEAAMGVWEVIKGLFNFVVNANPFNALYKIATKGLKGYIAEMKGSIDIAGNYEKGAEAQAVKNAEAAAKAETYKKLLGQRLLNSATALEKELEKDKAAGISAEKLYEREKQILEKRKRGYEESLKQIKDENSEAYKEMQKNIEDTAQELAVKEAAETKRAADEQKTRAANAIAAANERSSKELEAIRAAQDAANELIKTNQKREFTILRTGSERQIEDLQKRLDSEKNLTAAAREAINKQIVSIQEKYLIDEAAINDRYSKDQLAKDAADEQARIELLLLKAKEGSDEEFKIRQEQLELQRDRELADTELTESQKALIRAQYQKQIDENVEAQAAAVREQQAQALTNDFNEQLLKLGENEAAKAQLKLNFELAEQQRLLAMDAETKAAQFASDEEYTAAVIDSKGKIVDAEKAVQQTAAQSAQNQLAAMSSISGSINDLFSTIAGDNESMQGFLKVLALSNIAMNTATGIAGAVKAGAGLVFPANLGAIAIGVAAVLGGIASAYQALNKSKDVKAPKFAHGGTVTGAGSGTSDSIPIRVSNGESIMTAAATSMFAPILSDLNRIGGGAPVQAAQTGQQVAGEEMLARAVAKGIRSMPNPVVAVSEIQTVANRVQVLEGWAGS